MKYPIYNGIACCEWNDLELILEHTFSELRTDPKDVNVYMAEQVLMPKISREKVAEVMFEKFGVPGFYLQTTGVLSLVAAGRTSGIAVESGHTSTFTSVVYECHTVSHTAPKITYSGDDLDWYLQGLINARGYSFSSSTETAIVRRTKELTCFVSDNYERDLQISKTSDKFLKEYDLPDGRKVSLNSERFMVGECLFNPAIMKNDFPGIHQQIRNTLYRADPELRPLLGSNIVLSGGNTMFPGFKERLENELKNLIPCPSDQTLSVVAVPERKMSPWIGGSILASLSTMDALWITSQDYEEMGPGFIHTWCF